MLDQVLLWLTLSLELITNSRDDFVASDFVQIQPVRKAQATLSGARSFMTQQYQHDGQEVPRCYPNQYRSHGQHYCPQVMCAKKIGENEKWVEGEARVNEEKEAARVNEEKILYSFSTLHELEEKIRDTGASAISKTGYVRDTVCFYDRQRSTNILNSFSLMFDKSILRPGSHPTWLKSIENSSRKREKRVNGV